MIELSGSEGGGGGVSKVVVKCAGRGPYSNSNGLLEWVRPEGG